MSIKDFVEQQLDSAKQSLEYREKEVEETREKIFMLEQVLEKIKEK